jgi:hypothetical protein
MRYVSKACLLAALLLANIADAAFYDCQGELADLRADVDGLERVKKAHLEDKMKFSSECLEILLRKNFFLSSEYLLNEYYPKTSIDTEVIVKNVAAELRRSQDHLLFQVVKREKANKFPLARPVVYWAQSPTEVFLQVKL